jgi:hypothetical protein
MLELFSTTVVLTLTGMSGGIAALRNRSAALPYGALLTLLAIAGWLSLFFAPPDFWLRHRWERGFLDPYVLTLDAVLAIVIGAGLIVIGLSRRRS